MNIASNNQLTTAATLWILVSAEKRCIAAIARNSVNTGTVGAKYPRRIGDNKIAQIQTNARTVK